MTPADRDLGPLLFARYAYPPNELGYCGPADTATLLEKAAEGIVDTDLRRSLRAFEGAWPYLELIAHTGARRDPLDLEVVEAYWIGNRLLDRVGERLMAGSLEDRFRPRLGRAWEMLGQAASLGALPHHSFHVFGVYPYVGLLRSGLVDEPMAVLDGCRIRWGQVQSLGPGHADVLVRHLEWDGRRLVLGAARVDRVTTSLDGMGLTRPLSVGCWCSMHWGWVCDVLSPAQVQQLQRRTRDSLEAATTAPAAVLA